MGSRILGRRTERVLLGSRYLGTAAGRRTPLDAGLLGMARRNLCVERGLLGTPHRLLWRRVGYEGGRWENGVIAYNRTVNNFGGVTITNVYEKTVIVAPGASRVSFNGGSGGITLRPRAEEEAAAHGQHVAAIPAQLDQERTAGNNRALLASENCGQPPIAATAKPGEFTGKGVVAARSAEPTGTLGPKPIGAPATPPRQRPARATKKKRPARAKRRSKAIRPSSR
jgi:hypothetical protein